MSEANAAKLYSPQLLALSATLADYPFNDSFTLIGEARSRTCGSVIKLGLDMSQHGAITRVGMQVTACAIGQSSAAIMATDAVGRSVADIAAMPAQIETWLKDAGPLPAWPGFEALAPAKEHPGRHGALMLVWNAAREVLSSAAASS